MSNLEKVVAKFLVYKKWAEGLDCQLMNVDIGLKTKISIFTILLIIQKATL